MKRFFLSLLAFLAGPTLVVLVGWGVMRLQYGEALFNTPGRIVLSLFRGVGLFTLRDCSTRSKPQVCDFENAFTDMIMRAEAGVLFWLLLASLASVWWAWRIWRRSAPAAARRIDRTAPGVSR